MKFSLCLLFMLPIGLAGCLDRQNLYSTHDNDHDDFLDGYDFSALEDIQQRLRKKKKSLQQQHREIASACYRKILITPCLIDNENQEQRAILKINDEMIAVAKAKRHLLYQVRQKRIEAKRKGSDVFSASPDAQAGFAIRSRSEQSTVDCLK